MERSVAFDNVLESPLSNFDRVAHCSAVRARQISCTPHVPPQFSVSFTPSEKFGARTSRWRAIDRGGEGDIRTDEPLLSLSVFNFFRAPRFLHP